MIDDGTHDLIHVHPAPSGQGERAVITPEQAEAQDDTADYALELLTKRQVEGKT